MPEPVTKIPLGLLTTRLNDFQIILQQLLDSENHDDQVALIEILGSLWSNDENDKFEPIPQFSVVFRNYLGSETADEPIDEIGAEDHIALTPLEKKISDMLTQLETDFDNAGLHFPLVPELKVSLSKKPGAPPDLDAGQVCGCTIKIYCKKIGGVCTMVMRKCNCSVVAIGPSGAC